MVPPNANRAYYRILVEFMSFRDNTPYTASEVTFTEDHLSTVTPHDIARWFCKKAYGNPDPSEDDNPTEGRSSSLEHYKKALSFYMVNKLTPWNNITNHGNPTRSTLVNELIKKIKKKEVRKQGKSSEARRPMEKCEFEQMISLLEESTDIKVRYMVTAAAKFQFAMIGRIDDIAHFEEQDLKPNPQFDFALQCRMRWSKNVMEERDAPEQILFGAMDPRYCILLALGIYLEVWLEAGLGIDSPYLFGHSVNANANKHYIASKFESAYNDERFLRIGNGPLGSHSNRKFPTTFARRSGCSKDDVDYRGRWRKKRVSDRYIDINLPYPDAKVAAVLCIGGPIKYALKDRSGVSEIWLKTNVVPHMASHSGIHNRVALILALPLLWACFDNGMEEKVPQAIRNRVRQTYEDIRGAGVEPGENPVRKILLVVTGFEAEVHIDEVVAILDSEGGTEGQRNIQEAASAHGVSLNDAHWQATYSQVVSLRRDLASLRDDLAHHTERLFSQGQQMNRNIRRQDCSAASCATQRHSRNRRNYNHWKSQQCNWWWGREEYCNSFAKSEIPFCVVAGVRVWHWREESSENIHG